MNQMNPIQVLMQMRQNGVDPRQAVIQILSNNPNLGAVGQNLLDKAKANDLNGATNITNNIAREKGIDPSSILNQFVKSR